MPSKSKKRLRRRQVSRPVVHLPTLRPMVTAFRTVRYTAGSNTGKIAISRANLLNSLIFNTAGTTTNYRMYMTVRVVEVEMFAISTTTTGTGPVSIGLEWISENGPAINIQDTSLGSTYPAHIKSSPPADSLSRMWSVSGVNESTNLFALEVSGNNDVVDVRLEVVFQDYLHSGAPTAYTSTAAGTVGTMYTTPLDGASGKLVPISVNSLS